MFNKNDEYIDATKNARINTYDNREVTIKLWLVNITLFSLLVAISYYSYINFNSTNKYATGVMGVNHTNTFDNDLMVKLFDIEVDKITIERDNISISNEIKKIVDASSIATKEEKKLTFEKRILEELKLIN